MACRAGTSSVLRLALGSATLAGSAAAGSSAAAGGELKLCQGQFDMPGYGLVEIIPTGWADEGFEPVDVTSSGELEAHMDARAYFADECTPGKYDHKQYLALNLLGKTMRYTVDLTGAGCGCNAAFYLTSMRQNTQPSECSDYYCDANNVCGESCAEIDIMEANQFAWHSTLHTATDHSGVGGGFGGGDSWNGPRDWGSAEYGPGASCVDTAAPFDVAVSFPVDSQGALSAMEVTLSQTGKSCPLSVRLGSYEGMAELSSAIEAGMTPIVSYWAANDMLWMDGPGTDGQGPCTVDDMDACGKSVRFSDFSVEEIGGPRPSSPSGGSDAKPQQSSGNRPPAGVVAASGYGSPAADATPAPAPAQSAAALASSSVDFSRCARKQSEDCRESACCADPGFQCYEKSEYWAACKEACVPGSTDPEDDAEHRTPWSCKKHGGRTPGSTTSAPAPSSAAAGSAGDAAGSAGDAAAAGRPLGKVTVRVASDAAMPELQKGEEVTLTWGGTARSATVLQEQEITA